MTTKKRYRTIKGERWEMVRAGFYMSQCGRFTIERWGNKWLCRALGEIMPEPLRLKEPFAWAGWDLVHAVETIRRHASEDGYSLSPHYEDCEHEEYAKSRSLSFRCFDCKECVVCTFEQYMVRDDVWNLSGIDGDGGKLCVWCLERRIGRKLNSRDFTDCPLNTSSKYRRSNLLRARMETEPKWEKTL